MLQTSGIYSILYSVYFVDAHTGWAVGEFGIILKTTDGGSSWRERISGTSIHLNSIHFVDAQTGWAVGDDATILQTTDGGTSWRGQTSGSSKDLNSVHFVDAQTGWAVGGDYGGAYMGTILKTTDGGTSWRAQTSGTTYSIYYSVHFVDAQTGWAVGDGGTILKTTDGGSSWRTQMSGTSSRLYSVRFVGAQTGWAVGQYGTILKTTDGGASWQTQISGTSNDLNSVHFVDTQTGWVVGEGGTILKTADGGTSWRAQISGTSNDLNAVHFVDAQSGWAVGWSGIILKNTEGGGIVPFAPTLASPSNGATGVSTSPTLSWNASSGAASYRLQVSTSSTFSTTAIDESEIRGTSYRVSGLLNTTTYYWRVMATNATGTSDWSSVWSFTTAALSAPTLVWPSNGAEYQPTTLTLTWNPSSGATTYRLQVSTGSAFTTTAVDDSTITATSRQVGPLANNTTYYWRVNAKNASSTSPWSSPVWSFTTIIVAPSAPTLASPSNGETGVSTSPMLRWNASSGAIYRLQVSTSSTFSTTVIDQSGIIGTLYRASGLANNTIYYWRVNARNAGGTSDWSSAWSFTTIVQSPSQVALISPLTFAVVGTDSVRFMWRQSRPAINRYWFELATDSVMANAVIDSTLTAADTTKMVRQLLNNQTYWWRVRAKNEAGWGLFSEKRRFSVLITTAQASGDMPREFSLSQNYPNPFNPSTTIEYTLPKPSHVELKVYDMIGRVVQVLVNGRKEAGKCSVEFNAANLQSGVYFYRLRAGNFVETKKLILVK